MPFRIRSIRLQGFRGFDKPEEIALSDDVTLLYGENGSGKSSLLQAIEWAMTGSIPYMKGGDFTREDAIVNLFTKSKRAAVELSLQNEGAPVTIRRTRKMGTRTSAGKQPLELKIGDKALTEDEAEAKLEQILNISLKEFPQNKYLHQETLRDILQAKPEERTQAIDKLIGTYEVREFTRTLDADTQIGKAIKRITDTVEALQRDKVQFLLNLKRNLEEIKKKLLEKGLSEDELTLSSTVNILREVQAGAAELAETYRVKTFKQTTIAPAAQSLSDTYKAISDQIAILDRARLELMNKINIQKSLLQKDSARYRELCARFEGMSNIDSAAISSKLNEIVEELGDIGAKIKENRLKLGILPQRRTKFENAKSSLEKERKELSELVERYGSLEEITVKIQEGEKKLKEAENELEKISGQQRLITLAIEHLEATKEKTCPVCSQGIDNESLVSELKSKIGDDLKKTINNLRDLEKGIKRERAEFDDALREHKRLKEAISRLEPEVAKAFEELSILVPGFEQLDLEEVVKNWDSEIIQLSRKEAELRSEESSLGDTLKRFIELVEELKGLQTKLQKDTSSTFKGSALLEKVGELIADLETKAEEYRDSSIVDSLKGKLDSQSNILSFLRDEERTEAAEKELPTIKNQIEGLEARKISLQALASSLQSIRQAATQYEKEASITQLKRLEESINDYYIRIQGHPHFTRFRVDIEREDPLIFSFKAASEQEDTYIPTRFSTAQLNAAALSIFMSNSSQQAGELPIMILDDPTQNMDTAHKEAFAKLVASIPPKHQVIVATEDDETRRFLIQYCKEIKSYELASWTTEGPTIKAT